MGTEIIMLVWRGGVAFADPAWNEGLDHPRELEDRSR
jgi:hypothetical protein